MTKVSCGIDIGGSGVKGALVDLSTGERIGERIHIPTPVPSLPDAVAQTCRNIIDKLNIGHDVPVGITFPGPVIHGVIPFIANLDQAWAGLNVNDLMYRHLNRPAYTLNDADAAGLAEVTFGAGQGVTGEILMTTLGTGIGTAIIIDGVLVPNTELGHIELDGKDAESQMSAAQKTKNDLSWDQWAKRLQRYYSHLEMLFSPDLFIIGGGVSQNHQYFIPLLDLKTPIVPAQLLNAAGIVGAAHWADIRSSERA